MLIYVRSRKMNQAPAVSVALVVVLMMRLSFASSPWDGSTPDDGWNDPTESTWSWARRFPYDKEPHLRDPREPECGKILSRKKTCAEGYCSVREARQYHHPWNAAIFRGNNREYMCSGVLIRRDLVLTTATCVANARSEHLWVHLGVVNIRGDDRDSRRVFETPVSYIVEHPQYNEYYMQYDVAALYLESPVDYSGYPHIRPICLPESDKDFSPLDCYSVGWHMSPVKQIQETILNDAAKYDSGVALLPYTVIDGYVVTDDHGRVSRKSYRQLLLETPVKITLQQTCKNAAEIRGDTFLADGLQDGQRCLGRYEPGGLCIPDVGSAVSCMSYQDGSRRRRDAGEDPSQLGSLEESTSSPEALLQAAVRQVDGVAPCTPYPQLRKAQMSIRDNQNGGEENNKSSDVKFYLSGIVNYVGSCDGDASTSPEMAVFVDHEVLSAFLRTLIA